MSKWLRETGRATAYITTVLVCASNAHSHDKLLRFGSEWQSLCHKVLVPLTPTAMTVALIISRHRRVGGEHNLRNIIDRFSLHQQKSVCGHSIFF